MSIALTLSSILDDLAQIGKIGSDEITIDRGVFDAIFERLTDVFIDAANKELIPLALQKAIDVSGAGDNVIEISRARFTANFEKDRK